MTTASYAFLCAECSSPAVDTPTLEGAKYKCRSCGWEGDDPILIPFGNPFGGSEETFNEFGKEILTEFAKSSALPVGKVLVKWGFVPCDATGKPNSHILAGYIKAMATGMMAAVLRECERVEKEKANAGRRG